MRAPPKELDDAHWQTDCIYLRLLFFRTSKAEYDSFERRHLLFGLFCTWVVGMGRWLDDPKATVLQHLDLGLSSMCLSCHWWFGCS